MDCIVQGDPALVDHLLPELQVCMELERMVAAVGSFRGFLGPQFISVSGEAQVTGTMQDLTNWHPARDCLATGDASP